MKYTENYNLKKPEAEDFYNVEDFNENMEIIDGKLKDLEDNKETLAGAQARVDAHEAKPAPHSGHATKAEIEALYEMLYPIGTVYENAITSANPATYLGFGTWEPFGEGRVTVGVDTSQLEFNSVQKTGGAKTHTLTIDEIPPHTHQYEQFRKGDGSRESPGYWEGRQREYWTTLPAGGGQPHNNLQPYITVYRWLRVA